MPLHAFEIKWHDAAIDFHTWIFIHQQFHYTLKPLTRSISLSHLIETVFHSLSRFNSHALQFSWKFKFPPNGRRNVLQCKRKTVWKRRRNTRRKTGTSRATNKTTQSLLKNTKKNSHNERHFTKGGAFIQHIYNCMLITKDFLMVKLTYSFQNGQEYWNYGLTHRILPAEIQLFEGANVF